MIDLSEIRIDRVDYKDESGPDAGHSELNVLSAIYPDDVSTPFAGHDVESVRSAANWAAGVLARIAYVAEPLIVAERADHECSYWTDRPGDGFRTHHSCDVTAYDVQPIVIHGPSVAITVRTARVQPWLDRIQRWLREIQESGG